MSLQASMTIPAQNNQIKESIPFSIHNHNYLCHKFGHYKGIQTIKDIFRKFGNYSSPISYRIGQKLSYIVYLQVLSLCHYIIYFDTSIWSCLFAILYQIHISMLQCWKHKENMKLNLIQITQHLSYGEGNFNYYLNLETFYMSKLKTNPQKREIGKECGVIQEQYANFTIDPQIEPLTYIISRLQIMI